jgi:DNA helicase-2/ATP-dependent DNA helicase PcrA
LNPEQNNSVSALPNPPVFIVAGPGTGKTTVLALRVLKLILVDGFLPESIVATTFTRKAANELRSRILSWGISTIETAKSIAFSNNNKNQLNWLESLDINKVVTGTLDSIAEELIASERLPGQVTPAVIDEFVARGLLRDKGIFANQLHNNPIFEQHLKSFNDTIRNFSDKLAVTHSFSDRVLHDGIDINQYSGLSQGHKLLADAVTAYQIHLRDSNLIDFALLEMELLNRLKGNRLQSFKTTVKALLVDEFQDTNYLQEQIYYEICRQSDASLTVVGDDDQSIYRFRGATVEIFANFENRIVSELGSRWRPNRFNLYENYRSSQKIIGFFNHFIGSATDYQSARVSGKRPCIASATWANNPTMNVPVLGMFRANVTELANDLFEFLYQIFRGTGYTINTPQGIIDLQRGSGGDFGDAVFLGRTVNEYTSSNKERLPYYLRQIFNANGISIFNPRGRSLETIPEVSLCLGIMLLCIDYNNNAQNLLRISPTTLSTLTKWRDTAQAFAATNQELKLFISGWANYHTNANWPREWPLLELLFTVITWIPFFQDNPEGQVYLEVIARTIDEASQISSYGSTILFDQHYQNSVKDAIREIFVPIAEGDVAVNEDIMPYVPKSYFPLMTVHQAKGLEFPLTIVDVGSDFRTNHHTQKRFRFPDQGDNVHFMESHIANFSPVGQFRIQRNDRQRAFDDLRRLYYVAKSRAQNVLLLVGLTSQIRSGSTIQNIAIGDCINGNRLYNFIPADQWPTNASDNCVMLI